MNAYKKSEKKKDTVNRKHATFETIVVEAIYF
jgi:hypothetical protein